MYKYFYKQNDVVEIERWIKKKKNWGRLKVKKKKKNVFTVRDEQKSQLMTCLSFKKDISVFMKHVSNITHQFKMIRLIKEELKEGDIFIHMDVSQNWICKYASEVQSAHFGSSKHQVPLHTVVVHFNDVGDIKPLSFCRISDSLHHDPWDICPESWPHFWIYDRVVTISALYTFSEW